MTIEGGSPVSDVRAFRAHPTALHPIRQFIRDRGSAQELPPEIVNDVLLAVTEACTNAILHTASAHVRVTWTVVGNRVAVEIRDEGVFQRRVPAPDIDGRGGHGIPLMMALMDEVSFRQGTRGKPGTVVRLVKVLST
jgi:serine/threonine-protein kinase RsbW